MIQCGSGVVSTQMVHLSVCDVTAWNIGGASGVIDVIGVGSIVASIVASSRRRVREVQAQGVALGDGLVEGFLDALSVFHQHTVRCAFHAAM